MRGNDVVFGAFEKLVYAWLMYYGLRLTVHMR